ncbi:hypothetical protein AAG570_004429, partial [Ranatra chinensis]
VVKGCRGVWLSVLRRRFKGLELIDSTSPRSAVDTRRNQGIITVLLKIRGDPNITTIKTRIQEDIVDKKKSDGSLVYPHLKCVLSSGWGRYGWVRGSEKDFKMDNHVTLASPYYKGRPITEANVQDYISDMISKLLSGDIPPWQVCVVPTMDKSCSYLLIRVHHLYLSEDGLALGDLLMVEADHPGSRNILAGMFTPPVVIPQVLQHIGELMSNYWNELVDLYDPVHNPKLSKAHGRRQYVTDFAVRTLIAVVTSVVESRRGRQEWTSGLPDQLEKRDLGWRYLTECLGNSLSVVNMAKVWLKFWVLVVTGPALLVVHLIRETPIYLYWLYLGHYAVQECLYLLSIVYTAPRAVFEEVFLPEYSSNGHRLQSLSVCGRNVVSWSAPVSRQLVERIGEATGATPCEVLLAATAASLRDYFEAVGFEVPGAVMTASRFLPQEQLFLSAARTPPSAGMLCLPLPTATPRSRPLRTLKALQRSLEESRSKQAALYLASVYRLDYGLFTRVLPSVLARACLYLLSRKYAVSLTEIDSTSPPLASTGTSALRRLTWGPQVEKIMYWRPPQANVCK